MNLAKYNKFLIAFVAVVLTGLNVTYNNNPAVQLAISLAAAMGVYVFPNKVDKP